MLEVRCDRALRKAGVTGGVTRHSLQAQGIERPAEKHLGAKASAMVRNSCRMRKAEINQLISSDSRRLAEINSQLKHLKSHGHRKSRRQSSQPQIGAAKSSVWKEIASRIDPLPSIKPTGWLCLENRTLPLMEIELLEIVHGQGLHICTRQENRLVSLPRELQSDELIQAITSGEVNCLSGLCTLYDFSFESSNPSSSDSSNSKPSVLEFE